MYIRFNSLFLVFCLFLMPLLLEANDNFDPSQDCSEEVLVSFFPERVVNKALLRYKIPESQWKEITADLLVIDVKINQAVEKQASEMNPNPLTDLSQRVIAVKLVHDTKKKFFTEVMNKHGITDEITIDGIFDTIGAIKKRRFELCIENQGG